MKFDENGNKITTKTGVTLKESFLSKIHEDVKLVAEYLKTDIPTIQLKNGSGGDYSQHRKIMRIGLSDGNYTTEIRRTLVHEMLHHKGHEHGTVMGHSFMSHSVNDQISPILVDKIFKTVI